MKVLLGEFGGQKNPLLNELRDSGWGRMWSSGNPQFYYEGEPWGFDNGAWAQWSKGIPFSGDKLQRRMDVAKQRAAYPPCVAVAPDIVAGGVESLAFSLSWMPRLDPWFNWFLALQDGMTPEDVIPHLSLFTGLFMGGSNDFKPQAARWCKLAHDNGLKFHYARCNREMWVRNAVEIGADSIDTAVPIRYFVCGRKPEFRRFKNQVTGKCPQLNLW